MCRRRMVERAGRDTACACGRRILAACAGHGSLQAAFALWDNIEELVTDTIGGARKQRLVQATC